MRHQGGPKAPDGALGGGRAFAATPPLLTFAPLPASSGDAAAVLRRIAARISALPDDSGSGRYAMIATQSWYLWSRIDGAQVTSAVVPAETTTWMAADGSGFERSTFRRPGEDTRTEERRYAAGEHGFTWPLRSLSADDRTLARQLELGHPASNGPAERLVAVEDAYAEQVFPPAVRAAVLRYVAATPGLALRGRVHDRLGRPGIAVSLDSAYSGPAHALRPPRRRALGPTARLGGDADDLRGQAQRPGALGDRLHGLAREPIHRPGGVSADAEKRKSAACDGRSRGLSLSSGAGEQPGS